MAKQQVDIGTEGNDGTGDSIRESFKKVNEILRNCMPYLASGGKLDLWILQIHLTHY